MGVKLSLHLDIDALDQISCNNPEIDLAVVARFDVEQGLAVASTALEITATVEDGVPYACPLTRPPEERLIERFAEVCEDCTHSFISLLP